MASAPRPKPQGSAERLSAPVLGEPTQPLLFSERGARVKMEPEPETVAEEAAEVATVMSAAGLNAAEASSYLQAARGQVDLAVARAHRDRRQAEREAERSGDGGDEGELGRVASADLPALRRTVSSFVGRALVWVDCLFATDLMLPPPPPPSANAARDALGNYIFATLSVDGVSHRTFAVRRSCRPEWHAAFPFVVLRRKPFWLSATVSSLDGRNLAAGGSLVIAHAQATASFGVDLLATIEGDAPGKQGCIGKLHLAARKLRSKPAADVQSVLQLTTRPGAPDDLHPAAGGSVPEDEGAGAAELTDEMTEALLQLMAMGFEDVAQCTKAVQVADGNVETAVMLILNNDIPPTPKPQEQEQHEEEEPEDRPGVPPAPKLPGAGRADGQYAGQKWKQEGARWVKVPAARHAPLLQMAGFRPIWRISRGDDHDQQLFWWVLLPCDVKEGSVKFEHRRVGQAQWNSFSGESVREPNSRWWRSSNWQKGNTEYEVRCLVDGVVFCDGMREPITWAAGEPKEASAVLDLLEGYGPAALDEGTMLRRGTSTPVGCRSLAASAVGGGHIESRWDAPGSYLRHGRRRLRALQPAPQAVASELGTLCEPEVELLVRQRSKPQPVQAGAHESPAQQSFISAVFFESFKCVPCGKAIFDLRGARRLTTCGHQVCQTCLYEAASNAANGTAPASQTPCPHQPCENTSWLTPTTARGLLSPTDYDRWIEACLTEFTKSEEQAGTLVRCPECMLTFTRDVSKTTVEASQGDGEESNATLSANTVSYATSLLLDAFQLFRGCKPSRPPPRQVMDAMGEMRVLSATEKAHYEINRFRCPDCSNNFCSECDLVPYHTGFTCLGFQLAENQRQCRFCEDRLNEDNLAQNPPAESLQDCCTREDCLAKRDQCCRVILKCGHPCCGLCSDEDIHPPCLECGERNVHPNTRTGRIPARCRESHKLTYLEERNTGWACDGDKHQGGCLSGFTDHADETEADSSHGNPVYRCEACDYDLCKLCFDRACGPTVAPHIEIPSKKDCCFICTAPMFTAPVLQLGCGHIWHADCLKEIVEEGRQQNHKKLGFDYMKCPLCMQDMNHKYLEFEEKGDDALKKACEIAAMEQFDRDRQQGEAEAEKRGMTPLQYAMFHYEFAPCKQCRLPFFVRAHDCGADADAERGGGPVADPPLPMPDALCGTCREARGGVVTCKIHGKDSILWKCRYCCKMATYECFGYFHACDDCHPYEVLQHLMDFSTQVKADAGAKRGGVDATAFPEVYPNKKEICDYKQCLGPATCPLGAAHARTGFEHCFGCTQCAADKLTREVDVVLVEVLRKASGAGSYLSAQADPAQMDDLPSRLAHYLWRGGAQLVTSGWLTKKQMVHVLQVVMSGEANEQKLLELGVKGNVAAVAKTLSKERLGEAVKLWSERLTSSEVEDLLLRTRVVVSVAAPLEPSPQAVAAASAQATAIDEHGAFEVTLRVAVSYRELRDVDMQLANPQAPNDPDADDGDGVVIASTTPNDWIRKLGRLVKVAVGGDGAKNWPKLLELVPVAASTSEPEPEPENDPEPACTDVAEQLSSYETSLLLDLPQLFRGCKLDAQATCTPPTLSPLENVLRACRVGPVGDGGVMVARCRWAALGDEPEADLGTPETDPM